MEGGKKRREGGKVVFFVVVGSRVEPGNKANIHVQCTCTCS